MHTKLLSVERGDGATMLRFEHTDIYTDIPADELKMLEGYSFTEEEFEQILDRLSEKAIVFAAKMLGMRPLTAKLLTKRLEEKGFDGNICEYTVQKFIQMKALDDRDYAEVFAADRQQRGWGASRIRGELTQRGVDREIVDEVLEALDDPAEEIERFIRSRLRGSADRKEFKRISDALMRKGFRWEDIRPVLRAVEEEYTGEWSEL